MAPLLGGLGELASKSAGEAVAFGLGFALGRVLEPIGTTLAQDAWEIDPAKAVDAGLAAGIVAEDVELLEWGKGEAAKHGIDSVRFEAILGEVLNAPGFGELVQMFRRGTIDGDGFLHGLRKAKLETRWDVPLEELRTERLDPAVIATSIQRGTMTDPGLLPVGPPSAVGRVAPMPVVQIDPLAEAAAGGFDRERLAALTRIVGLPPAPGELLQLLNRNEIDEVDFYRGIAEGNTRNEWAPFLEKLRRRLLTPHEYAEANLRGWIEPAAMHAGTALVGMTSEDTDLLFKLLGRPIPLHQVITGLARGGSYDGPQDGIPEAAIRALKQGSMRPEWYNLAWANRYTYPAAFVLRALTQAGDLTEEETHRILLYEAWEPELAAKVAKRWAGGTGAKADPHVAKAQGQLWTALHKSYVAVESDAQIARANLDAIHVAPEAQVEVLALWDRERELVRATLTPKEIKKAYSEAKFTREEAIARLEHQGMNAADAGTLLDE